MKTTYWESEAKSQKLFKLKFSHQKFLRKWFRSYLELKNKCSECFKMAFFSFLQVLIDEEETTYWKSKAMSQKIFKIKFGNRKLLRKWFWRYLELKNECSDRLKSLKNHWTQEFVMESFSEKAFQAAQECNNMKQYQK